MSAELRETVKSISTSVHARTNTCQHYRHSRPAGHQAATSSQRCPQVGLARPACLHRKTRPNTEATPIGARTVTGATAPDPVHANLRMYSTKHTCCGDRDTERLAAHGVLYVFFPPHLSEVKDIWEHFSLGLGGKITTRFSGALLSE